MLGIASLSESPLSSVPANSSDVIQNETFASVDARILAGSLIRNEFGVGSEGLLVTAQAVSATETWSGSSAEAVSGLTEASQSLPNNESGVYAGLSVDNQLWTAADANANDGGDPVVTNSEAWTGTDSPAALNGSALSSETGIGTEAQALTTSFGQNESFASIDETFAAVVVSYDDGWVSSEGVNSDGSCQNNQSWPDAENVLYLGSIDRANAWIGTESNSSVIPGDEPMQGLLGTDFAGNGLLGTDFVDNGLLLTQNDSGFS